MIIALLVAIFLVWKASPTSTPARASLDYGEFLTLVNQGHVDSIKYDASSGKITGEFKGDFTQDGQEGVHDPGSRPISSPTPTSRS